MRMTAKNIARLNDFFRLHRATARDGKFTEEAYDAIAAAVEYLCDADPNLAELYRISERAGALQALQNCAGICVPAVDRKIFNEKGKKK